MVEKIPNARFRTTGPEPTGEASDRNPTDGAPGEGVRAPGTERGAGAPAEPFPLPLPGCVVWFMPDGGLRLTALSRNGGVSTPTGLAAAGGSRDGAGTDSADTTSGRARIGRVLPKTEGKENVR